MVQYLHKVSINYCNIRRDFHFYRPCMLYWSLCLIYIFDGCTKTWSQVLISLMLAKLFAKGKTNMRPFAFKSSWDLLLMVLRYKQGQAISKHFYSDTWQITRVLKWSIHLKQYSRLFYAKKPNIIANTISCHIRIPFMFKQMFVIDFPSWMNFFCSKFKRITECQQSLI